ncbi:uncharacterized protein [Asterias amurensis]|uniref:uncharacterized protein n=1 Tax=Asterias amurensis TaxID=7602 RepID=UPI003AB241CD
MDDSETVVDSNGAAHQDLGVKMKPPPENPEPEVKMRKSDKKAMKNFDKLHEEISKRERDLEVNVEATRQEVQACFRHCYQKLKDREDLLLAKLHHEHRRLKRSMLAPKRMAVNVNHTCLNGGMGTITECDSAGPEGNKNGIDAVAETEHNGNNTGRADFEKMISEIDKALELAKTPFHFSRADKSIVRQFDTFVDRLGMVYLGDADPSRSIVNAHPALVLAENTAKVKGLNQKGEECKGGGADIYARLQDPEGAFTQCKVTDCLNGVYKVSYVPENVGNHLLHVTMSGDPIRNSPLEVGVKPVRLVPSKAIIAGNCTVAMEMPREYHLSIGDGKDTGRTQKLSLQSLKISISDPEGKDVEGFVTGSVKRRGVICTYTLKYIPKVPGFYEMKVSRLGKDDILLAQVVIPVGEKEQIGSRGKGKGQFDNPTDIVLTSDGDLLVADTVENERLQCLTPDGQFKHEIKFLGQEPILLAVNQTNIIALLLNKKRVRILTLEGGQVLEFGHDGFVQPYGIAINSENKVYVSDRGAHCLFIFTLEGTLWRQIGKHGSGPGEFDFPNYIFIDPSDMVFVTEAKNSRVQIFKGTGEYMRELRSSDKLSQPGAVVATCSGYLLVHNESDNRVQILNLDTGRFTGQVLVDLIAPYTRRIAVTRTGFLVALDMSSHCLWRYPIPYE